MARLFIAGIFIVIHFTFAPGVQSQDSDSIGIYYDIQASNSISYLSEGSIRNSFVKVIDEQKPNKFERVFTKEDCLIILKTSIVSSEAANKAGQETGYFYSIHVTISTYPETNLEGLYFTEHAIGISGDKFNAMNDISHHGESLVAGVFGDLDPHLGIIYEAFLNED